MSLLKNAKKTKFKGIYEKNTLNDILYIIRYTINRKTKTKIVGKKSENMTPYLAYKIKIDNISLDKISLESSKNGIEDSQFNFVSLFKDFYEYRKSFLSKNTNKNYKSHLNNYFLRDFHNKEVQQLTKEDLQKYTNSLLLSKRPATVEKIINTLKQFFIYLQDKGILSYNPASNLHLPKYDNKKYFSLPKKDVKKLVEYITGIKDKRTKSIYMFLLHGRRISEVLNLKLENINLYNGIYKLESTDVKTKKTMFWKLEKFQLDIINDYYDSNKKDLNVYLFENTKTLRPITYTTFFKIHNNLKKDLNLMNFTLHNFRHLVGFLMINGGYSLEIIAKVLGHKSIMSTQRYSELKIDAATKAYSKIIKDFL